MNWAGKPACAMALGAAWCMLWLSCGAPALADEAQALFDQGVAVQAATNAAGARALFERLIEQYARSEQAAEAHYRVAQMLVATNPAAAAAHYAVVAATEGCALAEPAAFGRGEALYQAGNWRVAAEAYGEVLARYPEGKYAAQALYSRGWALWRADDHEAALRDFRRCAEKYPTNAVAAECQLKAGDCLRRLRRDGEAVGAYEQVPAGGRLTADALAGKAWALYAQREYTAAQGAFRAAAQAFGNDPRAAANLFNAGNVAIEAQQYPAAAEAFGEVQQAWPAHELARPASYWQALAWFRLGKFAEAAAKLELLRQAGVPANLAAEAHLLLAQAQEARQKFAEAAACYAWVATNCPEHALAEGAAAGRVTALEKAGELSAAEAAAAAFLQRYPAGAQRAAIQFRLGEYRYRQEKYAEAAVELERFAKAFPTNELAAAAWHKAGWCCWNLAQPARARELFAAVVSGYGRSPLAAEAAYMQGRAAEAAGDVAAAAAAYTTAVRTGATNESAQRAALELVRLANADRRFTEALAGADAFLGAPAAGAALLPRARLYRAEALLGLNRLAEAALAYRLAGEAADPLTAAGALYGGGWVLRRQGKPAEAAEAFGKVAAGNSTYAAEATFWWARALEDAGKLDAASAAYGACLRLAPPSAHADEAAYRQAYCLWQTHKPDDAEKLYSAVLRDRTASPFAANALYDLAWVMLEQGKKTEARQRFEEFVRFFPKHLLAPDASFRIAELACEKEDFAAAIARYEAAAAAQVAFRDKALYKLGCVLERQQQREKAAAAFLALARELPRSEYAAEAGYRAGSLLQGAGRLDDARMAFGLAGDDVWGEKAALALADGWRAAGKAAEAAAAYTRLLEKWPRGECRLAGLQGRGLARRAAGMPAEAIADFGEVVKAGGESAEAARAMLGMAHGWYALKKWEEAARCFAKVDVIYGVEELKPEALEMAARSWEQAGDAQKAAMYRAELQRRYPRK